MKNTEPWIDALTRRFVRANNLRPSDLDEPSLVSARTISVYDPLTGDDNNSCTFLFKGQEGNYQGSKLINYTTVNLEKLFTNVGIPVVYIYNPKTTLDVARALIARYGLPIDDNWFVDTPLLGVQPAFATISTKDTLFSSASSITVQIVQPDQDVGAKFANNVLDQPTLFFDPLVKSATIATYGKDFTPNYADQRAALAAFTVSASMRRGTDTVFANAWTHFNSVLNGDLFIRPEQGFVFGQYHVWEFYVRYHGPALGAKFGNVSADTSYDNVLIIEDNTQYPTSSSGTDGPLFIHYNDA